MIEYWTDERVQQLGTLWVKGDSASIIAAEMGITRNAVLGKAHRLKLESRRALAGFWRDLDRKVMERGPKRPNRKSVFNIPERKPKLRIPSPNRTPGLVAVTSALTGNYLTLKRKSRFAPEYTKDQLRAQLAQAMLNTARMG